MRYSTHVKSISYLKENSAAVLRMLAEQREPMIITQNGEARAVIQDVASYEETQEVLALLKLQDLESFSTMFLNYDLLAKRWVPYSYVYPFAEGLAGILMIAGVLTWLSVPVALFIGTVGAVSVFKAVYVDRRELKCACVGGSSNVPLGFVSLTENLMMIAMAVWMALNALGLAAGGVH